jgi:hypothetical protein
MPDGPRHLGHQTRRSPRVGRELLRALRQASALDVLHAKEMLAVVFAPIEHGHDVGVVKVPQRPRFLEEAADVGRRGPRAGQEKFDRYDPIHLFLSGFEDLAHTPLADLFQKLVVAQTAERDSV